METAKVIVIRHGETEWNVRGIWQGQLNSPLTEKGEKQATAVANRLKDIDIHKIYSSDLGRCLQTAQPTSEALNLPIIKEPRVRERAFGVLEGLSKEQSEIKYPGIWANLATKDLDYAPDGGESLAQKQQRFEEGYLDIAQNNMGKTVVVFTHGGGVDAILRHTLGIAINAKRPYTLWNCSLNVFQYNGKRFIVDTIGDTHHLKGFESAFRPR